MQEIRKVAVSNPKDNWQQLMDNAGAVLFRLCAKGQGGPNRLNEMEVETLWNEAAESDLTDPSVLCVNCGGFGRVEEENYQKGHFRRPEECATMQVYRRFVGELLDGLYPNPSKELEKLAKYIGEAQYYGQVKTGLEMDRSPMLSDIFATMQILLYHKEQEKHSTMLVHGARILLYVALYQPDLYKPLTDRILTGSWFIQKMLKLQKQHGKTLGLLLAK